MNFFFFNIDFEVGFFFICNINKLLLSSPEPTNERLVKQAVLMKSSSFPNWTLLSKAIKVNKSMQQLIHYID
jgi:hypothetical protein